MQYVSLQQNNLDIQTTIKNKNKKTPEAIIIRCLRASTTTTKRNMDA